MKTSVKLLLLVITALLIACTGSRQASQEEEATSESFSDTLPAPYATKSAMNFSNVLGWEDDRKPKAPDGFRVTKYADGFDNPRWLYALPNGDVLVAESNSNHSLPEKIGATIIGASKSNDMKKSADHITILSDIDGDGVPDSRETFLENLNQPFGMLLLGDNFYVANTDGLWRYSYKTGEKKISGKGTRIADLPAGKHNRHWTRNIIASPDESKIYVAVGSGSNVAEHGIEEEIMRANILEMNPDGSSVKIFASGLRNPVGMDWEPHTHQLWAAVNERDELGDDLVPDYLTHVERDAFYGWPYMYWGLHKDPRIKEAPAIAGKTLVPDVNLGPHTASLGLLFYTAKTFPSHYQHGAFVAQHGSWNRSTLSGYRVVFVPFTNGKPAGKPEDFLTGFIANLKESKVYGRPVALLMLMDGSLLVADDVSNTLWRVNYNR
jgi:glucose/arabinose dehydrogenase